MIVSGIILVVFGILILVLACIFDSKNSSKDKLEAIITTVLILTSITLTSIGAYMLFNNGEAFYPQAIDVYRGKTTLQITYKDTIPQDTIVVWK